MPKGQSQILSHARMINATLALLFSIDIMSKALGYIVDPVSQPKVRIERLAD